MPYVKKLVMHGFKSFATRTEILFENSMNVIVGPNGSGKSNITDALCFVLGRLSIKSMRAAKAANLLFSGNKNHKQANEAVVEMVFDNSDKIFALDSHEVSIKRMVKRNGLSVYKINNEVKTRQELLELMAQAGIDPNGFNIILQGEIDSLVKAHPEERRKIIEEVAGISIYETRKQKSLREMEKTDEKIKEVSAVLRERTNYLKNLEKEKQDALNYQKLEETIKRCKATILNKTLQEKEKEISRVNALIEEQNKQINSIKANIIEKEKEISHLQNKISLINKNLQSSTSQDQETIHKEIAELKAQIAGQSVRKENFESRINENKAKKQEIEAKIKLLEKESSEIKITPVTKKQQENIKYYQEKFDSLEKDRRKFYMIKSELSTLETRKQEKEKILIELKKETEIIEKAIISMFEEIKYAKSLEKGSSIKEQIKTDIKNAENKIQELENKNIELIKESAILQRQSEHENKLKQDIVKLDICPLCRSKITQEHINHVVSEANRKLDLMIKKQKENQETQQKLAEKLDELRKNLIELKIKSNEIDIDLVKIRNAEDKKYQIINIHKEQEQGREELKLINEKINQLRASFEKLKNIEEQFDEARLKLQDLSLQDVDLDTNLAIKQREITQLNINLKSIIRDIEESSQELDSISTDLEENESLLEKREDEERELYEKSKRLFDERNSLADNQKAIETNISGFQQQIRVHEERINNFKIQKAKLDAEKDSIKFEFREFESLELIQAPMDQIVERMQKCQQRLYELGSVNMKALEAYETVREQCVAIEAKIQVIENEKQKIIKIIEEIDKKKKKSFMTTLESVNNLFTRNFSQLSKKGQVYLELDNPQDPFAGGLNIIIKVARGKYFDITSLSGGERVLVALSLIFAIQEYKPYCFYVFDEIDAALDKHNSERLAALIKQYMTAGQYIIVTHNDALISESTTLYGVSMQENISKIISLKV